MVASIESLALLADVNDRMFRNAVAGVTDEMAVRRVSENANNFVFVAAHVIDARYFTLTMLGSSIVNPLTDSLANVKTIEDMVDPPSMSALLTTWRSASRELVTCLTTVSDDALRAPSPHSFPVEDGTILGAVAFLLQHESYHLGQLGFIRKCLGLPAVTYE